MANIKRANTSGITKSGSAISDVPDAPTIGAVTDTTAGGTVTVAYTAATTGGAVTTFTATSTPSSITGTGASPITVTGLTDNTAYTFKVKGTNSTATGPESAASSSVTPTSWLVGAYDSIATTTLTGSQASITFSSIPATYTHLQIRGIMGDAGTGGVSGQIQFNSDTGNNYSTHFITGTNSVISSNADASTSSIYINAWRQGSNVFGAVILDILDYANTNTYKTTRSLGGGDANGATGFTRFVTGNWRSTSAITSITIFQNNGNLTQYSSLALYGIKGA